MMRADERDLQLATQLIHHLQNKTWDPSRYYDTYRERVLALIKKKQSGEKTVTSKASRPGGKVLDLMTALKQSLESGGRKQVSSAEGKKQKAGAKTSKRSRKAA